jgi:hypothetical protein
MGLAFITSLITGVSGIKFNLYSFLAVTVLTMLIGFAAHRLSIRRQTGKTEKVDAVEDQETETPKDKYALSGRTLLTTRALGALIGLAGVGCAILTWKKGLGAWSNPTQEHDTITHSLLAAFIHFTGKAAPWQVLPTDLIGDTNIQFYPPGFPSLTALTTDLVGDTLTALNLVTVALVAVVFPLSVAALTVAVLRISGIGRGWLELAAGIAALVATVLYRPAIAFAHDGGVLANAAAMAVVPGLVAVMLVIGRRQWLAVAAIGVGLVGAIACHPSALISVGLTLVAAWIGLLFTKSGRTQLWVSLPPVIVSGVLGLVLAIPVIKSLMGLGGTGGSVGDSPADIPPASLGQALGAVVRLPYVGYYDRTGLLGQLALGILALAGVLAVLLFRRGWPILTAWLFWAGVTFTFHLSPNSGPSSMVGRFYYRVASRIDSHMYEMIPVLVACLFVFTAMAIYGLRLSGRFASLTKYRPAFAIGAVIVVLGVITAVNFSGYYIQNARALAQRYAKPEFVRYDASDKAAVDWLHTRVRPGETILNSANDGSTLAYIDYDLPIVNTIPDGRNPIQDRVTLLKSFNQYPHDPQIVKILQQMNIRWVYFDSQAPTIGTDPLHWNGGGEYSLAPGLQHIAGLPGLTEEFHSGTVTIYHLEPEQLSPRS